MKKLFLFSLLSIACLSAIAQIPATEIKDIEGKPFNTSKISNDGPIIIDFWATWCKPCVKELEAIAEYYEDW
ncbi:MAG: thiol:disulfide interchange protein, partial [Marinilabiliales bacterium]